MTKRHLSRFLAIASIIALTLTFVSCATVSSVLPSTIATVEGMHAGPTYLGSYDRNGLWVKLKPSSAKANVTYVVELYEKGNDRHERSSVSWSQPDINVKTVRTIYFPLRADEINAYYVPSIQDNNWWKSIFSVELIAPPTNSMPSTAPPSTRVQSTTMTPSITAKPSATTVIQPTLTLTSPKGGEVWHIGDTVTITWTSTDLSSDRPIVIVLFLGDLKGWQTVSKDTTTNTGSYKWVVNGASNPHARIQIGGVPNLASTSIIESGDFTISK